jgi:hypothetical protein
VNFLDEELPQLLKETEEAAQVLVASNKIISSTGTENFDCLPVCC